MEEEHSMEVFLPSMINAQNPQLLGGIRRRFFLPP